jgi:hypothetical protein
MNKLKAKSFTILNSSKSQRSSDHDEKSYESDERSTTSIEMKVVHPPLRKESVLVRYETYVKPEIPGNSKQGIEDEGERDRMFPRKRTESRQGTELGGEGRRDAKKEESGVEMTIMQKESISEEHAMIFGGLNTEKMALFNVYFPYNNCDAVIEYLDRKSKGQKKISKLGGRETKNFHSTTGLIHFRNLQNFYNRNSNFKKKPVPQRKISISIFRRKSVMPLKK